LGTEDTEVPERRDAPDLAEKVEPFLAVVAMMKNLPGCFESKALSPCWHKSFKSLYFFYRPSGAKVNIN
jgi:hypothetical protein